MEQANDFANEARELGVKTVEIIAPRRNQDDDKTI